MVKMMIVISSITSKRPRRSASSSKVSAKVTSRLTRMTTTMKMSNPRLIESLLSPMDMTWKIRFFVCSIEVSSYPRKLLSCGSCRRLMSRGLCRAFFGSLSLRGKFYAWFLSLFSFFCSLLLRATSFQMPGWNSISSGNNSRRPAIISKIRTHFVNIEKCP